MTIPGFSPDSAPTTVATTPVIDSTTILSLLTTVIFLIAGLTLANILLPAKSSLTIKALFTWHLFDALTHLILEGSYLYHCFFSSVPGVSTNGFLGNPTAIHGPVAGNDFFANLWLEYAKADRRWASADLTVVGLELLTVFIGGPMALGICEGLRRGAKQTWFWIVILATGELYGGFMTFIPEWLTGNHNLDGSNWLYLWLYLVFFNMLWVFIPIWAVVVAYGELFSAAGVAAAMPTTKKNHEKTQ